jgi:hypothetical protein
VVRNIARRIWPLIDRLEIVGSEAGDREAIAMDENKA